MAASGDTWGVSGPLFLPLYVVLAVAVTVAVVRMRRGLADVAPARPVGRLADYPYDVAFLHGGPELAVCAALSAMHRSETIAVAGRGAVIATARPDPRADELERAVHHAAVAPVPRRQLAAAGAVASALHRIEARLTGGGLLLTVERRRRIRATAGWTFAVVALGIARIVAGLGDDRPVGVLVVVVSVVAVIGLGQSLSAPHRTPAGDAVLRQLVDDHRALSPAANTDPVHGPAEVALAVGVFGLEALWAADPAFAGGLALARATAAGAGSGRPDSSCGSGSGGGGCSGGG